MNLLALLKEEIQRLNITDKVEIKDYIYFRTGELFNYDPIVNFLDVSEKEELFKKRYDKENITDFNANCFSWSYLFADLLRAFNIPARVVITHNHALVEAYINGETYSCDLMIDYQDIKRIKFGMDICNNYQKTNNKGNNNQKNQTMLGKIRTEDTLEEIKTKLNLYRTNYNLEDFTYVVFKTIQAFINSNFKKPNIGYVEGLKFIYDLLQLFMIGGYRPFNTHFYDKEKEIFIEVYALLRKRNVIYFAYKQNEDKLYELKEITKEEVEYYVSNYSSIRSYNLYPEQVNTPKKSLIIDREAYDRSFKSR